jgi:hypothetical protein
MPLVARSGRPAWRNEIDAAVGFEMGAIRTAALGNAEVRHYPCDHFDVWPGHDRFEQAAADQVSFLTRTLVPTGVGHGELSS